MRATEQSSNRSPNYTPKRLSVKLERVAHPIIKLQRWAGNRAVAQLVGVQRDDDKALLDREDRAIERLRGRQGSNAATFTYGNPSSPEYRPPKAPPTATLTIGELALRPTSDAQKRRSFESQQAAEAYATVAVGPAGAAIAKDDGLWFAYRLSAASASELKRQNVYRCETTAPIVSVIGTDRLVFTSRSYTPALDQAALDPDAGTNLARPSDAAALRDLVGISPDTPGAAKKVATAIPDAQAEAFIRSYFQARALETLDQNRTLARDLTAKFKDRPGGKLGGAAKELLDKSREQGAKYQELEDKERTVGETALAIEEKHQQGRWNLITAKGRTRKYFDWIDDINARLQKIHQGKEEILALSPMLASLVQHDPTPHTAGDWAAKLGWEQSTVRKGIRFLLPATTGLIDLVEKKMQAAPSWKDSDLSKPSSEAGDSKIADEFINKLDDINKALSKAYAKIAAGDVDELLSMGGLRARVDADFKRMGPENKAVKDKYQEIVLNKELKDAAVEVGGTLLSLAALLLPGGQFISAAIGLGMSMKSMSEHLGQWDTAAASVDPAKALVDQQELTKQLLFDTIALAMSAAEMATEVKGGIEALEQGRVPKALKEGEAPGVPGATPGAAGKAAGVKTVPDAVTDTAHGSHVHVTQDGKCLVCFSPCADARATFSAEIKDQPSLGGELSALEKEAAQAGATIEPTPALEALKPKAVAVEGHLYDAAIAARTKKVAGWLPSLYEKYPILRRLPLSEEAIGRVVAKWQNFNMLKGQLFEELTAQKILKIMETTEGRAALGARQGEKLELIQGHLVRESYRNEKGVMMGLQFSDGIVVVRNADGTIDRIVTIIEAKSGVFSSEKLAAENEGLKRLSSKAAKERRAEAIQEFRDRNLGDPKITGLSMEDIDDKFSKEINGIAKELNQKEGQVSRDLERIDQGRIQEFRNGEWMDIKVDRHAGKPKVFGVVPENVDAQALTKQINKSDPQVPFKAENLGKDLDSDAIVSIAGQIRSQSMIPASSSAP